MNLLKIITNPFKTIKNEKEQSYLQQKRAGEEVTRKLQALIDKFSKELQAKQAEEKRKTGR